jgi:hypothetical protein
MQRVQVEYKRKEREREREREREERKAKQISESMLVEIETFLSRGNPFRFSVELQRIISWFPLVSPDEFRVSTLKYITVSFWVVLLLLHT